MGSSEEAGRALGHVGRPNLMTCEVQKLSPPPHTEGALFLLLFKPLGMLQMLL